ncbi:AAA domain-containing protein [Haloferax volcanii]|uniref:AAA domain-containing protein n=1 Tax=Haloferax volcanii TaxID=2246 RepID=A0A6C0UU88_HALVO|nr:MULTISPECIES: AAA family ATPase [Haloferax]MBC9987992.1 AAA family ATPase [Haloferax sp. AS1]QIB79094.1 AAA domain-containing protein [Haloferax alexandrinus]
MSHTEGSSSSAGSEAYHVSLDRIGEALENLYISRSRQAPVNYIKFWLLLKYKGLEYGGERVKVDTNNVEEEAMEVIGVDHISEYIDENDRPFYDPFTSQALKNDISRWFWQSNTKKFLTNNVTTADPRSWLSFTQDNGGFYVSCQDEYYEHLGQGQDGFAYDDDSRVSISLIDIMAWYFRYETFSEELSYSELRGRFKERFNLDETELSLMFDESDTDMSGFYSTDFDEYELARMVAERSDSSASDLSDMEPEPVFSEDKQDVIIKSTMDTTYDLFDPDIDPTEDAVEAITEDGERNLLFVGPPGTGKTRKAFDISNDIGVKRFFFQFHQSYSYEDFVESYEPVVEDGTIEFDEVEKGFRKACRYAQDDADDDEYVFVILDEINRANVSEVFGELFSLIEYREEIEEMDVDQQLMYSDDQLIVPNNLVIIGTMNNLDKSTEEMEFALRRRFSEIEVPPSTGELRNILDKQEGHDWDPEELDELALLLNMVNDEGEYPLGHTYFKDTKGLDELLKTYRRRIRPSIKQYFGEYQEEQLELVDDLFQQAARMELSDVS